MVGQGEIQSILVSAWRRGWARAGWAVNDMPAAPTVEVLTEIWQRVLQRAPIGPEDNFFDLGGTDPMADSIFAEIARICRRELPSAAICYAPTVAALSALMEQPALPRFSPFVRLKSGSEAPPILIAHGLDGRASFSQLANDIRTGHSIYGIQARGVDGMEEPLDRVEDMAKFYLDALGTVQARGPYILIGYSFGGLVALEMAQRLSEEGENVALLVLIDAYPHPRHLSPGQRLRLMARRTRRHLSEMKQGSARDAILYFVGGLQRRLRIAGARGHGDRLPQARLLSLARKIAQVHNRAYVAFRHYRPRFYRGKIKFVKAEINFYFPDDPAAVWGKLANEIEVETVPGDHLEIVQTGFESLAAVLTRYVRGTLCPE
jgi:acetoacetyl-CoA synthetase